MYFVAGHVEVILLQQPKHVSGRRYRRAKIDST